MIKAIEQCQAIIVSSRQDIVKQPLADLVKRDITQLAALVKTRRRKTWYRLSVPGRFFADTGLDFALLQLPAQLKIIRHALAHL